MTETDVASSTVDDWCVPERCRHNIELSCAAESPARSQPRQPASVEPELNLRRQLQRLVMTPDFLEGMSGDVSPTYSTSCTLRYACLQSERLESTK